MGHDGSELDCRGHCASHNLSKFFQAPFGTCHYSGAGLVFRSGSGAILIVGERSLINLTKSQEMPEDTCFLMAVSAE
jgi:hypothetical protein